MFDVYLSLYIGQCTLCFRVFQRFFQKLKDTGSAGEGILQLCNDGTDIVKRFHILVCVSKHYRKSTDGQMPTRDQERAYQSNAGIDDVVDKSGGRIGQTAVKDRFLTAFL